MNKIFYTLCIFLVLHSFISAQVKFPRDGVKEVGLQLFLDSAFQNNPVIKDNENKLKFSELSLQQSIAELSSPKVFIASEVLFAPYLNNGAKIITTNPSEKAIGYDVSITNGGLYSATANGSLPLITVAGKKAYHDVYSAQTESYSNQIALTRHEVEQQVTHQYIVCYLSELQMVYVKKTLELLRNQKAIIKELVNKGVAKQSDYLLMGIEIQNQEILFSQYNSEYSTAFLQLKILCGIRDSSIMNIEPPAIIPRQLNENSNFLKIYHTDSLQIIANQHVFNLKYQPGLNLFANGGLNAVELPGIQRKFGVSAGLTFNWIIYDGKQKRLEEHKNALLVNTVQTYKTSFLKQHELQKQTALKQLDDLEKNIQLKKQQLYDFEQLLQMYKIQLSQGLLSVIDYLNTMKNYLDLQREISLSEANKLMIINEYNYLNW